MSSIEFIKEHYEDLLEILDCVNVGIYISDGKGNTLLLNTESEKPGGMSRKELKDINMKDLIEMGYVTDSSILRAINSHKEENIIQELGDGGQLFITGTPLFRNGELELVICTERDITETIKLKALLKEKEENEKKYVTELEYHRKREIEAEGAIIADSYEMKLVIEKAIRIARLDTTVLLTGESGTGKEIIANLIYKNSNRFEKPFIKVNCAAIPETLMESEFFGYEKGAFTGASEQGKKGFFELANEGTLFLDEIGELSIPMQSKLLRALQEKEIMRVGGNTVFPINVRIISATNVNLRKAIEEGKFREDLYYRLNIIPIDIPPLRTRKSDINRLAQYFVNKFNKEYKMSKEMAYDAIESLEEYDWPGNVRELKNVIERIIVGYDGSKITKFQVQRHLYNNMYDEEQWSDQFAGTLDEIMNEYERKILSIMIGKYHNASEVARQLQVNKSTISRKLKKYNISR